ncbi:branched-chain-amino-acid transaminase [Candidatus Aerophobetes bacterium]|nr:branched-chain-amino-acid transaminase [Candidatus Aerophobetes bacterium]
MGRWVYLNGEYVPQEEAKISIFDHGFLYGDGVFEGIRAYKGRVFRLDEHIQRLFRSARAISLKIPLSPHELREKIKEVLRKNELKDAYIRVVVSRGEGDLGLDPEKCPYSQLIIITDKISIYPEKFYEEGLEVITSSVRRNSLSALDPGIKSLNYLNNILAKLEATAKGVSEAIMLNNHGYVAECTGDNLFIVEGGVLVTPPAWAGILKGITRDVVIELAREENINFEEKVFTLFSVYTSDECFLTGTAAEIIPVTRVDGRVIGDGRVGSVTKILIKKFRELTEKEGVPIYE